MKDWEQNLINEIEHNKKTQAEYIKKHGKFNELCWALEESFKKAPKKHVDAFINSINKCRKS